MPAVADSSNAQPNVNARRNMRELRVTLGPERLYTPGHVAQAGSEVHMRLINVLTMSLSLLFIASCAAPDPPPPKKTVFDPLTQQLDRARDVQKTLDANSDATRKAVDTQERGDNPP
jgi:hypothetical protein